MNAHRVELVSEPYERRDFSRCRYPAIWDGTDVPVPNIHAIMIAFGQRLRGTTTFSMGQA